MIKTSTLNFSPQISKTDLQNLKFKGSAKKQLSASDCEPSEETILNILNYSKAVEIKQSSVIGNVIKVLN